MNQKLNENANSMRDTLIGFFTQKSGQKILQRNAILIADQRCDDEWSFDLEDMQMNKKVQTQIMTGMGIDHETDVKQKFKNLNTGQHQKI